MNYLKQLKCFFTSHDNEYSYAPTNEVKGDWRIVIQTSTCKHCGKTIKERRSEIDRVQYPGGMLEWMNLGDLKEIDNVY